MTTPTPKELIAQARKLSKTDPDDRADFIRYIEECEYLLPQLADALEEALRAFESKLDDQHRLIMYEQEERDRYKHERNAAKAEVQRLQAEILPCTQKS